VGSLARSRVGLNHVASAIAMAAAATDAGSATRRKRTYRLCRDAARNARSRPERLPAQPSSIAPPTSRAKTERFILEPSFLEPSLRRVHGPSPLSGPCPTPESQCLPRASYRRGRQKSPVNVAAAGPTWRVFGYRSL